MDNFQNVFKNKTILITGHTGFKGSWLSIWLKKLGANVIGYALPPYTSRDNYVLSGLNEKIVDIHADIRDFGRLKEVFNNYKPEIVFHLAAQPLVRLSYEIPRDTYETNLMGTLNILECIRDSKNAITGIIVTSDKCYENKEQVWGYKENDKLGGYDPYSSSKACTEILTASWQNSFMNPNSYKEHKKSIATVRAGNVIGGGDWAKDRIIPDCIRAIENNEPIEIRSPFAIRPWQHVLEPLSGYLLLAQKMLQDPTKYSEAWNFGPHPETVVKVADIAKMIINSYGNGYIKDVSEGPKLHEAKLLNLDISKAIFNLGWGPRLNINDTIKMTVDWYKRYKNEDVYNLCLEQIEYFYLRGRSYEQ